MSGQIIEWFNKAKNDNSFSDDAAKANAFFELWKTKHNETTVTDKNVSHVYKFIDYWLKNTSFFSLKKSLDYDDVIKIANAINNDEYDKNTNLHFYLIMRVIKTGKSTIADVVRDEIIPGYMYFYPEKNPQTFLDFMKDLTLTKAIPDSQEIRDAMEKKVDGLIITQKVTLTDDEKEKYKKAKAEFNAVVDVKDQVKDKVKEKYDAAMTKFNDVTENIRKKISNIEEKFVDQIKDRSDKMFVAFMVKLNNAKKVIAQAISDVEAGKNTPADLTRHVKDLEKDLENAVKDLENAEKDYSDKIKGPYEYGKPYSGGDATANDATTANAIADLTPNRQHKILESYKLKLFLEGKLEGNELSETQIKEFVKLKT